MQPPVSKCDSFQMLQRMVLERNMKAEQLRTEMLEKAANSRQDLEELHGSLEKLRAVKRLPRMAVLRQLASQERINPSGWDAYVRKHIVPYKRVSLPPDEEVDIDLLTNKLLSKGLKLLPPPHQLCMQNFFPSGESSLVRGMTRPRALVWGARLPNTLIITLLWSSRTLGDVDAERQARRRRLRRQLRGDGDGAFDSDSSESLPRRRADPHRRGGFGDVSDEELAAAEAVWMLQWEMTQPLRHRQRALAQRRSRREVRRQAQRASESSRSGSRRSRVGSRPKAAGAARSVSTDARSTLASSRQDVSALSSAATDRTRGSSLATPKQGRRRTRGFEGSQKSRSRARTIHESEDDDDVDVGGLISFDNRPVFKNVVSMPSQEIVTSMFTGAYEEDRRRATIYMREARTRPWMADIVPMIHRNSNMSPWDLNEVIMKNLPRSDTKLARQAIQEIAKLVDEFSCRDPAALRQQMLAIMTESWLDVGVFESALETLEKSLNMPSDKLIPSLLAIYPLCPEATRDVIDAYLCRVGLVDPSGLLRRELVIWAPPGARATSKVSLQRKAHHFLAQWRESWECNARLVAEELRQERLQAQVRADMVRALARHEPSVICFNGEEITLQLTDHPSEQFEKPPAAIDVLNYFVEMRESEIPEVHDQPQEKQPSRPPVTRWYRRWRRHNKELVCAERAGRALRGHPSSDACLQKPTKLVSHGEQGLSPLPWPAGTLNVRLRVAAKFFFHGIGHGDEGGD